MADFRGSSEEARRAFERMARAARGERAHSDDGEVIVETALVVEEGRLWSALSGRCAITTRRADQKVGQLMLDGQGRPCMFQTNSPGLRVAMEAATGRGLRIIKGRRLN